MKVEYGEIGRPPIHIPIRDAHDSQVPAVWSGGGPERDARHYLRKVSGETGAFLDETGDHWVLAGCRGGLVCEAHTLL